MFSRKFNTGSLPIPIPIFCFIFYWWSRSRLCNTAPYATECTLYSIRRHCSLSYKGTGTCSRRVILLFFPVLLFSGSQCFSHIWSTWHQNDPNQCSCFSAVSHILFSPNNNALDTHTGIYCIY